MKSTHRFRVKATSFRKIFRVVSGWQLVISGWLVLTGNPLMAQSTATWIWFPGDYEIWLGNQMHARRTERNAVIPPTWRLYSHQPQVNFTKNYDLPAPEEITVAVEGTYNIAIDGRYVQTDPHQITLPAGRHRINVQVFNQATPPTIFVRGNHIRSDTSWTVGPVPGRREIAVNPASVIHAGSWNFDAPAPLPSQFKLATREIKPVRLTRTPKSVLVDFGQETIGFLKLTNLTGAGKLSCYYGESAEEAMSADSCETLDHFTVSGTGKTFTSARSRALRFVQIQADEEIRFDSVSLLYEYLPLTNRGAFRCSDSEINAIWDVSVRTLELNTRELFLDGIKRDHWAWVGDAVQSYLMNYYTFFDNQTVKRTTWALRGADPVDMHLNTILDYSLYWFTGIYEYYQYSGDEDFLKSVYPRMVTLMDFVLARRNQNGMLEGLPGDWVFVDWAPMSKQGELSVIQILFARSLETMAICAALMNDQPKAKQYHELAEGLKASLMRTFWDPQQQVFLHSRKDGQVDRQITRYANMFAMMFGYLNPQQTESVKKNVLLNDKVLKITTPYMRFYELAALAETGQQAYVTGQMKAYWGGMLHEGATAFWEQYSPDEQGAAHYRMYGRPYGRSLCHAWGASPLYLIGKYYLGVKPTQPGYAAFTVEPKLGGLQWIDGRVPTPAGEISVFADTKQIKVTAPSKGGTLRFSSTHRPTSKDGTISSLGANLYEMPLEAGRRCVVRYQATD